LIEWAKSMKDKEVKGFTNHLWNGITTSEYALVCEKIIKEDMHEHGLFHLHSNAIDKYTLLTLLSERFNLNLDITPHEFHTPCDRTLQSNKELNTSLGIRTIEDQIKNI